MGPKRLRETARMMSTTMSRVPRKSGSKAQGAELREYLREDQAVRTEWISEQLRKVSANAHHFQPIITYNDSMIEEDKAKQTLAGILKETGLKDQIKKHLRARLAERLQGQGHGQGGEKPPVEGLRHRMIVSAVKEYLEGIGCSYAASVFSAESGYEQRMLQRREVMEILNLPAVDPSTSIVEYLFAKLSRDNPFLKHAEVQTVHQPSTLSIEDKFAVIDLEFRRVLQERNQPIFPSSGAHNCLEEKAWYEKQLARFREFEAHKIKVRTGEEWRIKFQAYAAEMEANYSRKLDKARQRERMLVEDLARKEKSLNERIQGWEASARSRMELLQMKEATALREKGNLQLQRKRAGEDARRSVGESKDKTREYQNLILSVEKRIAYEVGVAKLSLQQEQSSKEEQQMAKRKFVQEEYDKLMRIKDTMGFITKENQRLSQENEAVRTESQELRKELREVRGTVADKDERLTILKEDLHAVTLERQQLKTALEDEGKMRKKREEQLAKTRKDLDKLRAKLEDQSEESFDMGPQRPPANPTSLKIDRMREQRRKEIQRFKLEL